MESMPDDIAMSLKARVQSALVDRLVPFWTTRVIDHEEGGFIGDMSHKGVIDPNASKGLILNARLLWTYSALVTYNADAACLDLAHRAYQYLTKYFRDHVSGGYVWLVDHKGDCLDDLKKIYGQAFVIYALCEYHDAVGDRHARDRAIELFELIEARAGDHRYGGYAEACHSDWSVAEAVALSDKDLATAKSMNTHLHVLEAYTRLYRVWPEPAVRDRLLALIELFETRIVNPAHGHMDHFFDRKWQCCSSIYTFGHDVEASWLLWEAADALGVPEVLERIRPLVLNLARVTLEQGVDSSGGLSYDGCEGQVIHAYRDWWCQAEAVVGFLNAFELTGETQYEQAAYRMWQCIERTGLDREHGEWFWRVDKEGKPDTNEPMVSEWKGPYHNVRACLEILKRLTSQ
jgi:mannobiose 2-epimerase